MRLRLLLGLVSPLDAGGKLVIITGLDQLTGYLYNVAKMFWIIVPSRALAQTTACHWSGCSETWWVATPRCKLQIDRCLGTSKPCAVHRILCSDRSALFLRARGVCIRSFCVFYRLKQICYLHGACFLRVCGLEGGRAIYSRKIYMEVPIRKINCMEVHAFWPWLSSPARFKLWQF